eukprot:3520690-Amphidinium_carterae.1
MPIDNFVLLTHPSHAVASATWPQPLLLRFPFSWHQARWSRHGSPATFTLGAGYHNESIFRTMRDKTLAQGLVRI